MNNQKQLEKFFTRNDGIYITGACLLVSGLFCIWIGSLYSAVLFYAGIASAPSGLLLFILGSIGRIGHEDIDKAVSDRLWLYDKTLIEDPRLGKRTSQRIKPVTLAHFEYEGDNLMSKKGKDGVWRTSRYSSVKLLFLNDAIIYIRKTFSLLVGDGDGGSEVAKAEYKYTDLSHAEIIRDRVKLGTIKHPYETTRARLKITAKDGSIALFVQINDDIDSDHLADNINKFIKSGHA